MYGEWWIETRKRVPAGMRPPQRTVAGDLLDDGLSGWRLETIGTIGPGTFHSPFIGEHDGFYSQPHTIHGCDSGNTKYSLLDCRLTNGKVQAPSVRGGLHYWRVGMIVSGIDVMVTPEAEIDRIDVSMSDLAAWAFDPRHPAPGSNETDQGATQRAPWRSVDARIGDCGIELRWGWNRTSGTANETASPGAIIRVSGPLKLLEINEAWLQPLTRLISLLTGRTTYVTRIQARLTENFGREHRTYVEVRIPQPLDDHAIQEPAEEIVGQQLEMLAPRRSLEDNSIDIGAFIDGYFEAQEDDDLRDAVGHLIDSQSKTSGFKFDDSLLYGFNSFESYHGALHDSIWAVSDEVAELYDELLTRVPAEHQQLLQDRLNKTPPKSLLRMFDDVIADCGDTATTIQDAFPGVKRSLYKLRNTIAHTNRGGMTLTQRVDMLSTLHWIMRRALLQAFGIPGAACDQLIARNHAFEDHLRTVQARYGPKQPK